MRPVKDRSDRYGKGARAIPALPTLSFAVPAGMTPDMYAFAVWTNWAPAPAGLFQMLNRLLLSLKRLEEFEDVHGVALLDKTTIHL